MEYKITKWEICIHDDGMDTANNVRRTKNHN